MPGTQEKDSLTARLPRPPRRIRRRRGRLSILILGRVLTAPFVAVAAALAIYVLCDAAVMFLFPAEPAQIVDLWRDFKPHRGTQFYVKYRTTGTGFTGTDNALLQEFLGFHIGQPVKAHVFYFGRNNGYSLLDRSTLHYARYRMITWFCALFMGAIGWVLFYGIWLMPWRSRWLARWGEATFGAVTEKKIVHTNRRLLYCSLTYQFKVNGILRAHCIRISPQQYDAIAVGDLVTILFDPWRPNRNMVYDYCDYIAVRMVGEPVS